MTRTVRDNQGEEGGLASLTKMLKANRDLQGLMAKLTSNGQAQQVQSWVGTAESKAVSPLRCRRRSTPTR